MMIKCLSIETWDHLISLFFLALVTIALWPASFWLSVGPVQVQSARVGEPILMSAARTIHREAEVTWDVSVRQKTTSDSWVRVCAAQGSTDLFPQLALPNPVTLGWWTGGKCKRLPVGTYRVHTTWQLEPKYSPTKRVTAVSNTFEVTE